MFSSSYRISALDASIRMTGDAVVMVTRETDPQEVESLAGLCRPQPCGDVQPAFFRDLGTNEAALLPGTEESGGHARRFQLAPRLTAHVRHRAKYLDMPVADARAFAFTDDGRPGPRASTLKEFLGLLAALPVNQIEAHLRRHDFSRWLQHVFRDKPLARTCAPLKAVSTQENARDVSADIAQAIRARYGTAAERSAWAQGAPQS